MFFIAALSMFSCRILVSSARRTSTQNATFSDLARDSFGNIGERLVTFLIVITIYSAAVAYIVLQGDVLPPLIQFITNSKPSMIWNQRWFLMSAYAAIIIPISSASRMGALKISSLISLFSIYFLVIVVIIRCVTTNVR